VSASATARSSAPGIAALQEDTILGTARPAQERIDGCGRVTRAVELEGPRHLGRARHDEQRRLEERDGPHDLRNVERHLENDATACRVPDDVRPVETEMPHESAEGGCFPREGEGILSSAGVRVAGTVVEQQPMAARECGLVQQRSEPIRPCAVMHQHDALPSAAELVLQLDATEGCSLHAGTVCGPRRE
jgi:hypothetical protein